jgi:RNA polymerase sigma-70 factor (ECF subfamily)
MEKLLENQLILRCKKGDSSAFGQLIKQYKRQLFTYLVRLSGSNSMAEDLFQETLIKVWSGLPGYNEQNKFSAWLFSIAHNIVMDSYRKKKVRQKITAVEELPELIENGDQLTSLEENELKQIIIDSLKLLPERQRNVFLLRQHGEMSFKEIAEATGQNLNTVLSHMNYAVKKLRKILREKNAI